jgi:hypothetical protein
MLGDASQDIGEPSLRIKITYRIFRTFRIAGFL